MGGLIVVDVAPRFPRAKVETLSGADHWLHHFARPHFEAVLERFFAAV